MSEQQSQSTLLFIHGAGAQDEGQGSDGFASSLQRDFAGYEVRCPLMPQPEDPTYDEWKSKLDKEFAGLKGEVLLIGHSLGGSVLLKYISEESLPVTVSGLFMVAAPCWGADEDWQEESYQLAPDLKQLPLSEDKLYFYHSYEDNVVPLAHLDAYRQRFPQANYRELTGYSHDYSDGLPELVEDCRFLLQKES